MDFYSEIIDLILQKKIQSKYELHEYKKKLCKKYNLKVIPQDSQILAKLPSDFSEEDKEFAISLLRKKSTRTISGVAIVAVMTSPADCPHGLCIPCPGGPKTNTPQSYTGFEPAAMRASLNDFDPYLQTKNRLKQLKAIGHSVDKIDFIIMGGTFTARNPYYQEWFVKRCFDALNGKNSNNLEEAKKLNESAFSRCIGLTIETRPDWFRIQHADKALEFGATRVELGVQTVYDDILNLIHRGHTVSDSIYATRIAKDSGFKICFHLMPGLPKSDDERDINLFHTIFENPDFKPDMIKIYPTLTIKGTVLYDMWKKNDYEPLTTDKTIKIISQIKSFIPDWIRIQRIERDIPSNYVDAGVNKTNLRQYVDVEMNKIGVKCRCIRCREIGHKFLNKDIKFDKKDVKISIESYDASGSKELFISLCDERNDALIGYLRLRDIVNSHRFELIKNPCMIIRELKVVGIELPIGIHKDYALQHRGFGKLLIDEAERICIDEFDKKHLFVLSGVGVKEYYRKIGFKDNGLYLSKTLI